MAETASVVVVAMATRINDVIMRVTTVRPMPSVDGISCSAWHGAGVLHGVRFRSIGDQLYLTLTLTL